MNLFKKNKKMASGLNTSILDLYQLPWPEYQLYMEIEEEELKARDRNKNIHHQEKIKVSDGKDKIAPIKVPDRVNLPDSLKG